MPKVLFVIPNLDRGGSEKVFTTIIQYIDRQKFEITVVVVTRPGVYYDQLPPEIHKVLLGSYRVKFASFKIASVIRKIKPDVVFTFNVNHLNLIVLPVLILIRYRGAFITRESNILSVVTAKKGMLKSAVNQAYRWIYRRADFIIAQSSFMRLDLVNHFQVPPEKTLIINNPIKFSVVRESAKENSSLLAHGVTNLLAVGRLTYQKGFDLLIQALTDTPDDYYLTILGGETYEHPEYAGQLYQLVETLQLGERVHFAGFQSNPYPAMKQANLLILPSRHEGFPNVAIEAMSLGTPVVAFDSPGGQNDLIKNGKNGWLVPFGDTKALAQAIITGAEAMIDRGELIDSIRREYDIHPVVSVYESLLTSLVKKPS